MKKMMILLMIMTAGLVSPVFAAAPDSVTNPSFEDNTDGVCNFWTRYGAGMTGIIYHTDDATNAYSGDSYFEIGRGGDSFAGIHTALDQCVAVISGENATLSATMRWANGETAANATLKFEFYATQGEGWLDATPNTVETFVLTGTYTVYSLTTVVPAGMNFARATIVSEAGASFYIDDVSVSGIPPAVALVSPANESFVNPDTGTVNLEWIINALPVDSNDVSNRCDVWFSQDNADPATGTKIVNNLAVQTVAATISVGHDYYWRVDCYDPNRPDLGGTRVLVEIGDVWMFTTKNTGPTATAGFDENAWLNDGSATVNLNFQYSDVDNYPDPLDRTITVLPTANASFDIDPTTGKDPNAITFTAAGTYTITLTVDDGALQDTDSFDITVYAEGTAQNYLVAHYPFDVDASDATANNHDGTLTGNASIATTGAQVGAGALALDGTGDFVSIADSVDAIDPNLVTWADFVTAPDDEVTVAVWIKPTIWSSAYTQIVSKGYPNGYRLTRPGDTSSVVFATDQVWEGGAVTANAQYNMGDGKWHHLVGTWDGGALALYIDGNFQYRLPQEPGTTLLKNKFHLQIGANESADSTQHFNGLIDDVRIYSRGLSHAEVLKLYAAQGGSGTCGLVYADADLNRDCMINLADFALFASEWLDCRDLNPFGCQ